MVSIKAGVSLLSLAASKVIGGVTYDQTPLAQVKSRWDIAVSNDTDCYAMTGIAGKYDISCHTIRKSEYVTVRISGSCNMAVVDGTDCDADSQKFDADNEAECLEGKWQSFYVYGC